jgi:hypothetical protein
MKVVAIICAIALMSVVCDATSNLRRLHVRQVGGPYQDASLACGGAGKLLRAMHKNGGGLDNAQGLEAAVSVAEKLGAGKIEILCKGYNTLAAGAAKVGEVVKSIVPGLGDKPQFIELPVDPEETESLTAAMTGDIDAHGVDEDMNLEQQKGKKQQTAAAGTSPFAALTAGASDLAQFPGIAKAVCAAKIEAVLAACKAGGAVAAGATNTRSATSSAPPPAPAPAMKKKN